MTLFQKIFVFSLLFNMVYGYSQSVQEVQKPTNMEFHDSVFAELWAKRDSGFYTSIDILEHGLESAKTDFDVYRMTLYLGFLYSQTEQYDKSVEMWLAANKQGICHNYQLGDKPNPAYLSSYTGNDKFLEFMQKNDSLLKELAKDSKAEYFVNLPSGYDASGKYPLLIVMHGGSGSNHITRINWQSETLNDKFITVYTQGRYPRSSFSRSYGDEGIEDIKEIYSQVKNNYSVDTTSVILAGQSAGGELSLNLINGHIQAKGLFLAFPVKPGDFDFSQAQKINNSSERIYMVCGEQDKRFYPGQVELANLLDSADVENKVIRYPTLGHGFPDDFEHQLNTGLEYILNNN